MNIKEYNAQIIKEFLEHKTNVPHNTFRSIKSDCKSIQNYAAENNLMITMLSEESLANQYISFLSSENRTTATIKRMICTLRSIIYWCKAKGYIHKNQRVDISDNLSATKPQLAMEDDIQKLYSFCSNIYESDEYFIARAKLECYIVIMFGLKTSELKSLLVNDLVDENANNRLRLLRTFNKDSVENYLQIRRNFLDERQIKSDFLFFTKSGGENANINVDFELLRDKCCIKNNITLASIRNNCMTIFSNTIGNEELSALLFDVTIWRIKEMREQNLIITLPCTVGTMVYMILDVFSGNTKPERKILSGTIDNFKIGQDGVPLAEICIEGNGKFSTCIYGKDYYLTYEEAEKVMKGSFETYFCDVTAKTGQGMT